MNYKKLFIGYLFLLNIPVKGYDILPDALGLGLMLYTLIQARHHNKWFKTTIPFAVALLIVTIPRSIGLQTQLNAILPNSSFVGVIELVTALLLAGFYFYLIKGLRDEYPRNGIIKDGKLLDRTRFFVLVTVGLQILISIAFIVFPEDALLNTESQYLGILSLSAFLALIFNIISFVYMSRSLYRLWNMTLDLDQIKDL